MYKIRGYLCEGGYHAGGRSFYLVDIRDGRIFDADPVAQGVELFVRQYGSDAPILTNGVWEFWPDESELTRLNLVPTQMVK